MRESVDGVVEASVHEGGRGETVLVASSENDTRYGHTAGPCICT